MDLISLISTNLPVYGFILFATVASFFPGIPEEIFLITLGYTGATTGFGVVSFGGVTLLLVFGFLVTDSLVYYWSRRRVKVMIKFANLLLSGWFNTESQYLKDRIRAIIFFSRFVPQFRFIGSYFAGTHRYPYWKFLLTDILALLIYTPLMLGIGAFFKSRINEIIQGVSVITNIFSVVFALLLFFGIVRLVRKTFKTKYSAERLKNFMGFIKIDNTDDK